MNEKSMSHAPFLPYEPLNYPIQGILRPLFLSLSPLSSLSRNSLPEGTTIILTFESKHIRVGHARGSVCEPRCQWPPRWKRGESLISIRGELAFASAPRIVVAVVSTVYPWQIEKRFIHDDLSANPQKIN